MTQGPPPICLGCARYDRSPDRKTLNCEAFPEGIPFDIIINSADHRLPYPGDGGLRFLPESPAAMDYAREMFGRLPEGDSPIP